MNKHLIWIIGLLVLAGLFVSTTVHSPQRDNPVDRKQVSRATPQVAPAPATGKNSGETPEVDTTWLIKPGKSVGKITHQSTLADLEAAFGKTNVKTADIYGAEGETLPGAVIYDHDPMRRAEVLWKSAKDQHADSVRLEGNKSYWHTAEGITLGTSLKELEQLNGHSFTLAGFGWDYGGTVFSWGDQGKLHERFQKTGSLLLRLSPPDNAPQKLQNPVQGDRTFSSSNPAMQQLNPTVEQITVILN